MSHTHNIAYDDGPVLSADFDFETVFLHDETPCRRCAAIFKERLASTERPDPANAMPLRLLRWQLGSNFSHTQMAGIELRAATVCWAALPELRPLTLEKLSLSIGRRFKQSLGRCVDDFKREFPDIRHPKMK